MNASQRNGGNGHMLVPAGARGATPRIIALVAQKGGAGKTTVAVALIGQLLERGLRVLLVDADPQANARQWANKASRSNHPAPTACVMGEEMHLAGQLERIAPSFDHVIIDCPAGLGSIPRSALCIADLAILPSMPGTFDVWSFAQTLKCVREVQTLREVQNLPALRAVALVNRKIGRTAIGSELPAALEAAGVELLGTELHQRVVYAKAPGSGLGIAQYKPTDPAATEIAALTTEIFGEAHVQTALAITRAAAPRGGPAGTAGGEEPRRVRAAGGEEAPR